MPPHAVRTLTAALLLLAPAWGAMDAGASAADPETMWTALARGGHVALMRHAHAPGIGDPPEFRVGDCSTQRNLNATGRAQAQRAGEAFRHNGLTAVRVLSSEWCRCQETATLLDVGTVEIFPALNSLHGRREYEASQVAALRHFLNDLPVDGPSVVLVSHNATIAALTGVHPQSGAIVVLALRDPGVLEVAGSIPPP